MAFPAYLRRLLLFLLATILVLAGWSWYELTRPLAVTGGSADVRVPAGSTARSIAGQLREAGVPVRTWEFVVAATLTRTTRVLRAGRYHVGPETSVLGLVEKFRRGDVEREQLTITEGITFADMRQLIADSRDLRHDTRDWSEAQILQALGATQERAEGLFAPDTYTFDALSSDLDVYRQAYLSQMDRLEQSWQARTAGLPYSDRYQALIMASIIEKETGRPDERRQVAAVFVNRQRLGMPLQTDPTVIYGLGESFNGRLRKRDLQHDTAYNTYTRNGLPPTPISLPGRAAIDAALNPDPIKALYFVARGDGTSEFSATLIEHNRAVGRFQRSGPHVDAK